MPTKYDLLYYQSKLDSEDQRFMRDMVQRRYARAYLAEIQSLLNDAGVNRVARISAEAAAKINELVNRDVQSMTDTYDRELRNQITRQLQADTPYSEQRDELQAWMDNRQQNKFKAVARASAGNAGELARTLFLEKNKLTSGQFTWYAVPPIIATSALECIRRVEQGAVSWETAKDWERVHPNCRHIVRRQGGVQTRVTFTG